MKEQTVPKNIVNLLNKVIKTAYEIVDAGDLQQINAYLPPCVEVIDKLADVIGKLDHQGL